MQRNLAALASGEFDVVVIGGGICGAAAAWDAVQRGLSVALLERGDFGEATSANSLKVVHGGIRYLQHLDLARVRESSRERSALLRIAPHLVKPMPVLAPAFGHGGQGPEALGAAFLLLNMLTYDRNRGLETGSCVPRARLLSRLEALDRCPEVERPGLTGAGLFWDGQLQNPPRLVWSFVRTAAQAGAVVANYCEVQNLLRQGDRVVGVTALDRMSHVRMDVQARLVINAAGPFAESFHVRAGVQRDLRIPLSRDLALVVARRPTNDYALALPTRYRDPDALLSRGPRHLFLVPWQEVTLVGVHSAVFRGDPASLSVSDEEVRLFLDEVNDAAPWLALRPDDVSMVYAGLLPAGADALVKANMSFGKRSHVIDNACTDGVEGLVTAVPNRFTTARGVAERAVDLAARKLGRSLPACRTAVTPLFGAPRQSIAELRKDLMGNSDVRLDNRAAAQLARNHGSDWPNVLRPLRDEPALAETLGPSQTLGAEVVYAVRQEMAQTLADCVFRRTDIATAGDPGDATLRACGKLMAAELGWSSARQEQELEKVRVRFPRLG
jgi:glycerol-3-phosphate dehydrogenase